MDNIQQDVCDTNLDLRLGYSPITWPQSDHHLHQKNQKNHYKKPQPSIANPNLSEPSLSIGPPGSDCGSPSLKLAVHRSSSLSTVSSSLSKPTSDEEEEEEEEEGRAQKKLRLTKEQSALMEGRFKEHSTLNLKQKQALAKTLNLSPRQVEVWFQNRRARNKMKQTEVSREFLRKWCETLAHENRMLKEEVRQLKATKRSVCPTCNRAVDGAANNGLESESFAPFNPFPHSAHC